MWDNEFSLIGASLTSFNKYTAHTSQQSWETQNQITCWSPANKSSSRSASVLIIETHNLTSIWCSNCLFGQTVQHLNCSLRAQISAHSSRMCCGLSGRQQHVREIETSSHRRGEWSDASHDEKFIKSFVQIFHSWLGDNKNLFRAFPRCPRAREHYTTSLLITIFSGKKLTNHKSWGREWGQWTRTCFIVYSAGKLSTVPV